MRELLTILLVVLWLGAIGGKASELVAYKQIHAFNAADGEFGYGRLTEGSDGKLYSACVNGGALDGGVVFRVNRDGTGYELLHDFIAGIPTDGLSPWGTVIEGSDGALYGAARRGGLFDGGIIFKLSKDGSSYEIVRHFTTNVGEAFHPINSVIEATDGRLYGRTIRGGAGDGNAIFGMNKDGSGYTVLHSFGARLRDHYTPFSGVIEGSDGALYGTTVVDGADDVGSVFKIGKDGSGFVSLYDFQESGVNGYWPEGGVVEADNGRLYGTVSSGGIFDWGVLFTLNKDGSDFRILHHFSAEDIDGYNPTCALTQGPGGLLYGTTYFGGFSESGTLYTINKSGANFTIIYRFKYDDVDGWGPYQEMTWLSDGSMCGATFGGGVHGSGTLYRIMPVAMAAEASGPDVLLTLSGFKTHRYSVQAAREMTDDWAEVGVVTNVTGSVQFRTARSASYRFYRAEVLNP